MSDTNFNLLVVGASVVVLRGVVVNVVAGKVTHNQTIGIDGVLIVSVWISFFPLYSCDVSWKLFVELRVIEIILVEKSVFHAQELPSRLFGDDSCQKSRRLSEGWSRRRHLNELS